MNACYLVTLSFGSWFPYAMFGWVRAECGLWYELPVVWDTERLIKLPGGTDCYYYINNMTCPINAYYLSLIHI